MKMPVFDLRIHVRMRRQGRRILLTALPDADLPVSNSGWDVLPEGAGSLLIYYFYSDPGEISWLVRKLLQQDPAFDPGLNLATGLVQLRAMSDRASAGAPHGLPR